MGRNRGSRASRKRDAEEFGAGVHVDHERGIITLPDPVFPAPEIDRYRLRQQRREKARAESSRCVGRPDRRVLKALKPKAPAVPPPEKRTPVISTVRVALPRRAALRSMALYSLALGMKNRDASRAENRFRSTTPPEEMKLAEGTHIEKIQAPDGSTVLLIKSDARGPEPGEGP